MRYAIVGVMSGVLFAVLDGVLNANPLAQRLFAFYKPIARTSMNPVAGTVIDIAFGFVMVGVFLLLQGSLPGGTGLLKGLSSGILVWIVRVVMSTASQWVMFRVPVEASRTHWSLDLARC